MSEQKSQSHFDRFLGQYIYKFDSFDEAIKQRGEEFQRGYEQGLRHLLTSWHCPGEVFPELEDRLTSGVCSERANGNEDACFVCWNYAGEKE